jgi:hypothetical protein
MGYKLFLDDDRNPVHCVTYMQYRIGRKNFLYLETDWVRCRNYRCCVSTIETMGLPDYVSFDHDLSNTIWSPEDVYDEGEKTGYECAKWMVNYCLDHKKDIPPFAVHSMNPSGAERIMSYLKQAESWTKKQNTSQQ